MIGVKLPVVITQQKASASFPEGSGAIPFAFLREYVRYAKKQAGRARGGETHVPDEVVGNTPEQMARFVREERARWADVVKAADVTLD